MSRCPIYPKPSDKKISLIRLYFAKKRSIMDAFCKKNYRMKMGVFKFPFYKLFIVNDLKEVKKMMVEKPNEFPKDDLQHEILEPLLGESIFTTNGEVWQRQRDLLIPGFKQNNVEKVFSRMLAATASMQQRLSRVGDGEVFDIEPEMTLVTADIIFRAIMSSSIDEDEARKVVEHFSDYQERTPYMALLRTLGVPNNWIMKWADRHRIADAKFIRKAIEKTIKARYAQFEAGVREEDILTAVFETSAQAEYEYSIKEITDQIVMLFLAGHETSAAALTWTIYLIAKYPEEQDKLLEEILNVRAQGEFTFKDIKQFKYLKQVFQESLRLYPPVGSFFRQVEKETQIRGKTITPKDQIMIAPWLLQRHEDNWDRPHEYCPHRFDQGDPSARGAYIPFGMGQRVCIGMSFAIQEAMLILATLIRDYRFELEAGFEPQPEGKLTIRSANGLRVKKCKRESL